MRFRITTEEQREKITQKLADMLIDHVNEEAEDKARECVNNLFDFNMNSDEELQISYTFKFNGALLKILLGSVKRENAKKEKKKKNKIKKEVKND